MTSPGSKADLQEFEKSSKSEKAFPNLGRFPPSRCCLRLFAVLFLYILSLTRGIRSKSAKLQAFSARFKQLERRNIQNRAGGQSRPDPRAKFKVMIGKNISTTANCFISGTPRLYVLTDSGLRSKPLPQQSRARCSRASASLWRFRGCL